MKIVRVLILLGNTIAWLVAFVSPYNPNYAMGIVVDYGWLIAKWLIVTVHWGGF